MSISRSLRTRVADFLAQHPPFSYVERGLLEGVAEQVKIRFYAPGAYLFEAGDPSQEVVFVLQKGRVAILQQIAQREELIDMCEVGDVFGMRSFMSGQPYVCGAKAEEDTLVYVIPKPDFDELLAREARVALHFASGFAAGMPVVRGEEASSAAAPFVAPGKVLFQGSDPSRLLQEEALIGIKPKEDVVWCAPSHSIQEAALRMRAQRVGSVLVLDEQQCPLGIVTNMDLMRQVCTGDVPIEARVATIMSHPVITVAAGLSAGEVILKMMRHNVRHLVVTRDGSPASPIVGVISEHDVLLAQGNNPAVLLKQMKKARTRDQLARIRDRAEALVRSYLEQEVSVEFVTGTITALNDALIARAIELGQAQLRKEGLSPPNARFCWLSLGSEGRGEQMLRTDQDNALLYEDPAEAEAEATRAYYLKLGTAVTDVLEHCGFAHCPGEIMASNPRWCQPLAGWKRHFASWIQTPEPKALMHGTIFFDFRPTHGPAELGQALQAFLKEEMARQESFFYFFAQNAMGNPAPLSFFKNFIVERSGKHKDEFDIKLRAMMPLTDVARVLLLHHGIVNLQNTLDRYQKLAELEPQNQTLFQEAEAAYALTLRHRALNGFAHGNSGRYLDPSGLNKIERQTLKYAFRTINELQSLLRTRFSLRGV